MNVKYACVLSIILLCITNNVRSDSGQDGILTRAATSVDSLLTQKGAGTFSEMQRLIMLYGPCSNGKDADILKYCMTKDPTFYMHLLRDAGYLCEGFFAHCGMLLSVPVFAGIDTTPTQIMNPHIFFQTGVVKIQAPQVTQGGVSAPPLVEGAPTPTSLIASAPVQAPSTIAQACGSLFHASRYMRILTDNFSSAASMSSNPADLCAGVIVINNGWVCSLTMPSANSSAVQQKGNLFCLPAGISGQDAQGNVLGFVKNHTIDFIPFAEGIDQWSSYNGTRTMKLVVADDIGSAAFVSSSLGNGVHAVTLQITREGKVEFTDAQGNVLGSVTLNDAVRKFYGTLSGPWAVIIEMDNRDFKEGDLFPTLTLKGIVKLNYVDFPLQFQAPQSQKIGSSFSVQSIVRAPEQLLEEVQFLSR